MIERLTGFIPAGGLGSRLSPHTDNVPKPLLVMGLPDRQLIDVPLEIMAGRCDQTFVSTHYKAAQLAQKTDSYTDVRILHEERALGNAGALIEHYDTFSQLDPWGSVLIIPSDHVVEGLELGEFDEVHQARGADITVAAVAPKDYGLYVHEANGKAQGYTTKDNPNAVSTIGIYMIRNQFLINWARRQKQIGALSANITYDLVEPQIETGLAATYRLPEGSYWDDAGTHARYHANNMRLSAGNNVVASDAEIDPRACVERCVVLGGVLLDEAVVVTDAVISRQQDGLKITRI